MSNSNAPLFVLPQGLTKAFRADIAFAGIERRDERGHVVDLHSLRHTFITWLAQSGASVAVTQKMARHSDPKLTMGIYTHLGLNDLAAAVEALPEVSVVETDSGSTSTEVDEEAEEGIRNDNSNGKSGESVSLKVSCPSDTARQNMSQTDITAPDDKNLIPDISHCKSRGYNGGPCRDRTCDLVIKSHLLYQLSYPFIV